MVRKKADENKITVGNVTRISGKVTIAGGDIYEGYSVEQVSLLLKELTTNYRRKPMADMWLPEVGITLSASGKLRQEKRLPA